MTGSEAAKRLRVKYGALMVQALKLGTSTTPNGYARRDFSEADLDRLRTCLRSIPTPEGLIDIHDAAGTSNCQRRRSACTQSVRNQKAPTVAVLMVYAPGIRTDSSCRGGRHRAPAAWQSTPAALCCAERS
jgi:hypothetical protein